MQFVTKYREVISGLFMFGVGGFYFCNAFFIKKFSKAFFNASMFPKMLGIALMLLSLVQIGIGVKKILADSGADASTKTLGKTGMLRISLTLVALFIYLAGLREIGFLIMTCFYVFVQILILTPRERLRLPLAILLSTVFPAVVYLIFVYGFQLMLPRGILNF